ncbi:MAG TPA: calcium-binding protein, partial [Candidatus Saccharibacteria bacterium]|nr:calcium-binding protein [Candidatus Saccharibacteria bacterium]
GSIVDLAGIAGITNFVAAAGVVAGGSASVTNLGQNATVEIAGNNTSTAATALTNTLTFADIGLGETIIINGLTYTQGVDGDGTAANIAAFFANKAAADLDNTHTSGAAVGVDVTFTSVATGAAAPNLLIGGTALAPADDVNNGQNASLSGALVLSQETDTAADVLNLKLNNNYTENNDATSTITGLTHTITASKVETLNVESTGKASTKFLGAEGHVADGVNNTLALTNNDLVTLNVTGDQAFTFTSAAGMTKLATIDASALTAGATIDASAHVSDSAALTITGSATAANDLTGGATADTIIGGEAADTITSSAGADTITLGGGNDTYVLAHATDSVVNARDVITDFNANTVGQGANGAATVAGAAAANLRNGDVIDLSAFIGGGGQPADGVNVAVFANASDATTFLANSALGAAGSAVNVALDSSTGALYLDINDNGIADSVITLTGVETIDAAAFVTGL